MLVVRTIKELRKARQLLQGRIGLVPTMGYLHAGHMSLVRYSKEDCDKTIVTIFVNPTQFSVNEDLSAYPRNLPSDLALLESEGVDVVFTPDANDIYPMGFQTYVNVEEVSKGKEGQTRQNHFRGVTTIVAKLFNLIQPDIAYFGQKDAQQVVVIRQMVRDLNFPVQITVCPIVRENDGLAMSSRNVYLKPEERQKALILQKAIKATSELYASGERHPRVLRQQALEVLSAEPTAQVDYVSVSLARNLQDVIDPSTEALLVSMAVKIGKPRLLDNCLLPLMLNNSRKGVTSVLGTE
jgi:pantoate--beta-alanine ligase